MRGHPSAITRQPPYRSRVSPKSAEHTTRHGVRSRSVRRAVPWAGTDAYVALELGERFLPRPTTTFTKRRLYCWRSGRRTGGVSVAIGEVPGEAAIEPKARNRNGDSAYLETLDGATLGELLLVLLGDLGGLTANLTGTSEGTVDLAHLVLRCVMRTPERPIAQKSATGNQGGRGKNNQKTEEARTRRRDTRDAGRAFGTNTFWESKVFEVEGNELAKKTVDVRRLR